MYDQHTCFLTIRPCSLVSLSALQWVLCGIFMSASVFLLPSCRLGGFSHYLTRKGARFPEAAGDGWNIRPSLNKAQRLKGLGLLFPGWNKSNLSTDSKANALLPDNWLKLWDGIEEMWVRLTRCGSACETGCS